MSPSNPRYRPPVEAEFELATAVDPLAVALGQPGHPGVTPLSGPAVPGSGGAVIQHLVGARVALGDEPRAAARAVIPPLALDPGDVTAKVVVDVELAQLGRSIGRGTTSPP